MRRRPAPVLAQVELLMVLLLPVEAVEVTAPVCQWVARVHSAELAQIRRAEWAA